MDQLQDGGAAAQMHDSASKQKSPTKTGEGNNNANFAQ